jgi:hypothetical protein
MPAGNRSVYYAIGLTEKQMFDKFTFFVEYINFEDEEDTYFDVHEYLRRVRKMLNADEYADFNLELYNNKFYEDRVNYLRSSHFEPDNKAIVFIYGFKFGEYGIFDNFDFDETSDDIKNDLNKFKNFFKTDVEPKYYTMYNGDW